MKELDGKRALVTGGTRAMGHAIARRLISAGATMVTTARSAPVDAPTHALFVQADASTPEGAATIVSAALDRLGAVNILVNNVGGSSAATRRFQVLTDDA